MSQSLIKQGKILAEFAEKTARGEYTIEHLRPSADPAMQEKFWPLWNERCAVQEKIAAVEAKLESLVVPLIVADAPRRATNVLMAPIRGLRAWLDSLQQSQDMLDDAPEYRVAMGELAELKAEEAALTAQMRPYQEKLHAETFPNIVTDLGAKDMLDRFFKGAAYTQTIRMGLKGTGTAVVADTQASHASWLEQGLANAPTYTGNRKDVTMNVASGSGAGARSSASPTQAFAITGTGTVFGCFINNGGAVTIDNTTGVLFSAGDFTGGSRAVINGDTLNVTYTLTL